MWGVAASGLKERRSRSLEGPWLGGRELGVSRGSPLHRPPKLEEEAVTLHAHGEKV